MKCSNYNNSFSQEYMESTMKENEYPGEVRMLCVSPQTGLKMVYECDPELEDIFTDDSESIYSLKTKNIYFSCATKDLLLIGKRVYLIGTGVAYKLDRDDNYADMNSEEMAEVCLELLERMQKVRMSCFCFPVLDLTGEEKDEEKE